MFLSFLFLAFPSWANEPERDRTLPIEMKYPKGLVSDFSETLHPEEIAILETKIGEISIRGLHSFVVITKDEKNLNHLVEDLVLGWRLDQPYLKPSFLLVLGPKDYAVYTTDKKIEAAVVQYRKDFEIARGEGRFYLKAFMVLDWLLDRK